LLNWVYGAVAANGTAGLFGVWNMYNRVQVASFCGDNTDTWTYAVATVRAANASNTMRHQFVSGLAEDVFMADYTSWGYSSLASGQATAGICYDTTTVFSGRSIAQYGNATDGPCFGDFATTAIGFHFFQAGEVMSNALSTANFYGDFGGAGFLQTGMNFRGLM
jgi:hypothetical protein